MRVVIAGCGRVGTQVAEMMSMDGHEVVVIDTNKDSFRRLSKLYAGELVEGLAFDEETLVRAGIEKADAFASVTNFDNTNLMAAEVATQIFRVPRVVSRLYNPDKEQTFAALDVDYVCGTTCVADIIMERLVSPHLIVRGKYAANKFLLVEFSVPRKWDGREIADLERREGFRIAFISRLGELILPNGNVMLRAGDSIVISIKQSRARRLEKMLRK